MHRSLESLPLSTHKKDYIRNTLNPVLEKFIVDVLEQEPADPTRHACAYFRKMSGIEDELQHEILELKVQSHEFIRMHEYLGATRHCSCASVAPLRAFHN